MKRYIKPNTEIHQIELTQMIAASGDQEQITSKGNLGGDTSSFTFGGKESETISSSSVWDEEE